MTELGGYSRGIEEVVYVQSLSIDRGLGYVGLFSLQNKVH